MFEIVVEGLRVVAAFSEGRGEGCVWRASKDLIFFFSARSESHSEEPFLQTAEEASPHRVESEEAFLEYRSKSDR